MPRGLFHMTPLEKFEWHYIPEPMSGCWIWLGTIRKDNYGVFCYWQDGAEHRGLAHRLGWELMRGRVQDGFELDHLCRNRWCVNPDHLEPVVHSVNVSRGISIPARNSLKTHCWRGHELIGDNILLWRTSRVCRKCAQIRMKEFKERRHVISKAQVATV